MNKLINVVYDVDDVLNNLNDYVFKTLKLPVAHRFNIRECSEYTKEQQDAILAMYGNPETFRNLSYVPGASEICKIEKTGKAEVHINSRNFNQEVADIKLRSLTGHIPELKPDNIELQIGFGEGKRITEYADIVIEDCLTNLQLYSSRAKKILINKPYNQAREYCTSDWAEGFYRVQDLIEANALVERMVLNWDTFSVRE